MESEPIRNDQTRKRGRLPFEIPAEVQQGLMRVIDYSDVPFDDIASAVESSGGPRKNWLRKWVQQVTGTKKVDQIRLRHCPKFASTREKAQRVGIEAMTRPERRSSADEEGAHESFEPPPPPAVSSSPELQTSVRPPLDLGYGSGHVPEEQCGFTTSAFAHSSDSATTDYHPSCSSISFQHIQTKTSSKVAKPSSNQIRRIPRAQTVSFAAEGSPASGNLPIAHSHPSWPSKRDRSEEVSPEEGFRESVYARKRRRTFELDFNVIGRKLANISKRSGTIIRHIVREKSLYAESWTSASRTTPACSRRSTFNSTMRADVSFSAIVFMEPNNMRRSEFERWYQNPDPDATNAVAAVLDTNNATTGPSGVSATSVIAYGRLHQWSDDEAAAALERYAPPGSQNATAWVNFQDTQGVSPLHLTVAYGLIRCSNDLVRAGANCKAKTKGGASVYLFSRPAQDLAKPDIGLYHRIMHCRQWIQRCQPPPVSEPPSPAPLHGIGRSSTSLETIDVTVYNGISQSLDGQWDSAHTRQSDRSMASPFNAQRTPLPFDLGQWHGDEGAAGLDFRPEFTTALMDSPASLRAPRGSMESFSDVVDFAHQDSRQFDLRRMAATNTFRRSPTALSLQQSMFHPVGDFGPIMQTSARPYPSHFPRIQSCAVQSAPNLGRYDELLLSQPDISSAALPDEASRIEGLDSMRRSEEANDECTQSVANFMNWNEQTPVLGTGLPAEPAVTLPDTALLPSSLAPCTTLSMATNGLTQHYQAFPDWQHGVSMGPLPFVDPPGLEYQTTALDAALGSMPLLGFDVGSSSAAPIMMSHGGTTSSMLSHPETSVWINCPHGLPVGQWRSFCDQCDPRGQN